MIMRSLVICKNCPNAQEKEEYESRAI
jgi:hypothetical protein